MCEGCQGYQYSLAQNNFAVPNQIAAISHTDCVFPLQIVSVGFEFESEEPECRITDLKKEQDGRFSRTWKSESGRDHEYLYTRYGSRRSCLWFHLCELRRSRCFGSVVRICGKFMCLFSFRSIPWYVNWKQKNLSIVEVSYRILKAPAWNGNTELYLRNTWSPTNSSRASAGNDNTIIFRSREHTYMRYKIDRYHLMFRHFNTKRRASRARQCDEFVNLAVNVRPDNHTNKKTNNASPKLIANVFVAVFIRDFGTRQKLVCHTTQFLKETKHC